MKNQKLRILTGSAILIALAEILSLLPFYKLPWGGSIDLAMLPIIVICVRWGFGPGMMAATAHAIIQALLEGGIALGWQSIIGDFFCGLYGAGPGGPVQGQVRTGNFGRLRDQIPGPLCGGRYRLGRVYAGGIFRYDHDHALGVFRPV